MPHLTIDPEGWEAVVSRYTNPTCANIAAFIDLPVEEVERVLTHGHPPSEQFIAACLLSFPARFDDLFTIVLKAA